MSAAAHNVLIVGLGTAARTHLRVLEQIPGADVIAGMDISGPPDVTFRGRAVPVYRTVRKARDRHDPGIVVITTPTPLHAATCAEVAASFPGARILVEKPAAGNLADARAVLAPIGRRQQVDVAYHMSFSPEVMWGMRLAQARAEEFGPPTAIEASFTDPYQDELESAVSRFGSSWTGSGINSLSIINRFAEPVTRGSLRRIGEAEWSAFEARITCRAGGSELTALILTSWHVTDAAKTTRVRYRSGAELVMDHTAVAGYLVQDAQISAIFGSDRTIPRRERHHRAPYQWWLADGKPIMPVDTSLLLHELLLQPANGQDQR